MNSTSAHIQIHPDLKITVSTEELQAALGCGRSTAVQLGEAAGAKVQLGKRVLWNVSKLRIYIDSIST